MRFLYWCCERARRLWKRFFGTTTKDVDLVIEEEEALREERRLRLQEAQRREEELSNSLPEADNERIREIQRRLHRHNLGHYEGGR